jgi:hypothetical protein
MSQFELDWYLFFALPVFAMLFSNRINGIPAVAGEAWLE